MSRITLDELRDVLRSAAGEDDLNPIPDDFGGRTFDSMGYDSLAVLETVSALESRFGVRLSEDDALTADTPLELLALVEHSFLDLVG